jgi:hypothetical protein
MQNPSRKISLTDYANIHQQFFCYGWWRKGVYLYIGVTTIGNRRFVLHNILGKVEPFQENDEIHFWDIHVEQGITEQNDKKIYESKARLLAYQLESELIKEHNPIYNINKKLVDEQEQSKPKPCEHCQQVFTPSRFWQKFCSTDCQTASWLANKTKKRAIKDGQILQLTCVYCKKQYEIKRGEMDNKSHFCPECRILVA